jgi:hypothetical protein
LVGPKITKTVRRLRTRTVVVTRTAGVARDLRARDVNNNEVIADAGSADEIARDDVSGLETRDLSRHLCPVCPADMGRTSGGSRFCCPAKRVITKRVRRKTVTRFRTTTVRKTVTTMVNKMVSVSGFLYADGTLAKPLVNESVALATVSRARALIIIARNTTSRTGFFVISTDQFVAGASGQLIQTGNNKVLASFTVGMDGAVAEGGDVGNVFPGAALVCASSRSPF